MSGDDIARYLCHLPCAVKIAAFSIGDKATLNVTHSFRGAWCVSLLLRIVWCSREGAHDKAASTDVTEALRVSCSIFQIQNHEEECQYSVTLKTLEHIVFLQGKSSGASLVAQW